AAVGVTKTSTTQSRSRAPATAFGPSARNSRRSVRTERRLSLRASLTRLLPTVKGSLSGLDQAVPEEPRDEASRRGTVEGSGRLGSVDVLGKRVLGGLDQRGEGRRVVDGQVGQDLAVDLDAGQVQALDEPVVGHPVRAGRGVDPLDPELAEVALARLAVAV